MTPLLAPLDVACQLGVVGVGDTQQLLSSALPALAEAGYRRIVLPRLDPTPAELDRLRAGLAHHGMAPITMAGVVPGADVGSADPAERRRGVDLLRAALEFTVTLGGDQLNGVPYGVFGERGPTDRARFERAARAVGQVADEAHRAGVVMTFEVLNRYETSVVNTAEQAVSFVEASGSAHLRIHLDTFHMAIEEAGFEEAIRRALPWLGYLELGQSGRGALDVGTVDVPAVVAAALDAGYDGRWGIEAFARCSLPESAADRLAIWRSPYEDGIALARDAQRVIRAGWDRSVAGRRARREARTTRVLG